MSNIGTVTGITGTSMNLNSQANLGGEKPNPSAGTADPGKTKPPKPAEKPVPMPR